MQHINHTIKTPHQGTTGNEFNTSISYIQHTQITKITINWKNNYHEMRHNFNVWNASPIDKILPRLPMLVILQSRSTKQPQTSKFNKNTKAQVLLCTLESDNRITLKPELNPVEAINQTSWFKVTQERQNDESNQEKSANEILYHGLWSTRLDNTNWFNNFGPRTRNLKEITQLAF